MEPLKPNFLIVGAARSGTTSLYYWLRQHPEVFMPSNKEPSYFLQGYGFSDWDRYLALFQPGMGKKAIGEASAGYLVAPESPAWIYQQLGRIKIVIVLRDPVPRALSLYAWMVMEGYEWLTSFEAALASEEQRWNDDRFRRTCPQYFWDYLYFRSGLNYEPVQRYLKVFGAENVKIYLFENLARTPAETYRDLCQFLEISTDVQPDLTPQNAALIPRSLVSQYWLRRFHTLSRWGPRILYPLNDAVVYPLMNLNRKWGRKPILSAGTRVQLQAKYREDILQLSQLIQKDLSRWLTPRAQDPLSEFVNADSVLPKP